MVVMLNVIKFLINLNINSANLRCPFSTKCTELELTFQSCIVKKSVKKIYLFYCKGPEWFGLRDRIF